MASQPVKNMDVMDQLKSNSVAFGFYGSNLFVFEFLAQSNFVDLIV